MITVVITGTIGDLCQWVFYHKEKHLKLMTCPASLWHMSMIILWNITHTPTLTIKTILHKEPTHKMSNGQSKATTKFSNICSKFPSENISAKLGNLVRCQKKPVNVKRFTTLRNCFKMKSLNVLLKILSCETRNVKSLRLMNEGS